jgi:hypothetical protein
VSHEACSLLSFLRNASVMHPNHMSNYIYCVYVSKMHRKRFFYEVNTHLILFFEQTFPLKIKSLLLPLNTPSLVPVYEFVCNSFRTGNLNCFRVK